jgi:hypothetical protein
VGRGPEQEAGRTGDVGRQTRLSAGANRRQLGSRPFNLNRVILRDTGGTGFPQVRAGCTACRRFWLDNSVEVRLDKHAMDVDTAETMAGVVRLLRQAALLAWAAADRAGAGSPGQLFALGVDLAADQARHLVPDGTDLDGPVPVGDEPAGLLRSAELPLRRLAPMAASDALDDLRATVANLVWEANTGVGG